MDLSYMIALETEEISSIIEKASLFGGQLTEQGTLSNRVFIINKIDLTSDKKIIIKLSKEHGLEEQKPLIVNLSYRNLHFKMNPGSFRIVDDSIICHTPTEARALALRNGGDRHVLPFNTSVTALVKRTERRSSPADFSLRLVDVSKSGLGVHLVGAPEGTLYRYDHLWIKEIFGVKLEQQILGRVEYISNRKFKDSERDIRAGISLDRPLPEEVYQELVKLCRLVLSA